MVSVCAPAIVVAVLWALFPGRTAVWASLLMLVSIAFSLGEVRASEEGRCSRTVIDESSPLILRRDQRTLVQLFPPAPSNPTSGFCAGTKLLRTAVWKALP